MDEFSLCIVQLRSADTESLLRFFQQPRSLTEHLTARIVSVLSIAHSQPVQCLVTRVELRPQRLLSLPHLRVNLGDLTSQLVSLSVQLSHLSHREGM